MKLEEIIEILACPICHGSLFLGIGSLRCDPCNRNYSIVNGIPILIDGIEEPIGKASLVYGDPRGVRDFFNKRVYEIQRAHYGLDRLPSSGLVIDVGCGPGVSSMVAARRGLRVIGMDISFEMVAFARQKAHELGVEGCLFLVGDSQKLPFRSGSVDWILNYANLAHIRDPERCLADMARVASKDGKVIIQSINHFCLPGLRRSKEGLGVQLQTFGRFLLDAFKPSRITKDHYRLDNSMHTHEEKKANSSIRIDTHDIVSFLIHNLCRKYYEILHYETFPNFHGWHDRLLPDLSTEKVRRRGAYRLKDSLFGVCQRIPFIHHMGTDIFLVCQPLSNKVPEMVGAPSEQTGVSQSHA
ncbi:methyltransferase domain-containing protein [Nitrospinae bacterium AH_259_B05_G02_I21]|nr:methyltransferase domain-containing protein [Nitrospinae bacterium AH_259_B05_G02_I21]MDA2931650.1 methyltransferase domain-containing protein [Nitrospinae bacterium AH-259-F20]